MRFDISRYNVRHHHTSPTGQVRFGIEYPEPPIFLASWVGASAGLASTALELLCERRDRHGVWLQRRTRRPEEGDSEIPREEGPESGTERVGWIALPAGKLWALDQYDDYQDDDRMTAVTSTVVSSHAPAIGAAGAPMNAPFNAPSPRDGP